MIKLVGTYNARFRDELGRLDQDLATVALCKGGLVDNCLVLKSNNWAERGDLGEWHPVDAVCNLRKLVGATVRQLGVL